MTSTLFWIEPNCVYIYAVKNPKTNMLLSRPYISTIEASRSVMGFHGEEAKRDVLYVVSAVDHSLLY